ANSYVSRDHLNLKIEVDHQVKLSVPIHHLESVCIFGQVSLSAHALQLCWEQGVPVNYFSETGYLLGRWEGVPNTSVGLRRAQYRVADDPRAAAMIARQCVAGKLQNSRQSLLRSARETDLAEESARLQESAAEIGRLLGAMQYANNRNERNGEESTADQIRGYEGQAASIYFGVFNLHLRHQREDFNFTTRTRRPPRDAINCLLSFLYALLRHDCIAALTATGLDPFVGYLHSERPNRPALALDLMEEFRPLLADRLAITLINRKQINISDFIEREGGVVEFTTSGRKSVITAYQARKQETVRHPLLDQEYRVGQLMLAQARIMARHLRGDLSEYLPCILR
ncbi:MAG: type I-C CRISPR-associated endonuclease Cas1, partial [Blastocatellia bacterium]|nr:type I-C CRISPR-associated endonuclease Cas1 [Blastocatellia bacterium]